MCQLGFGHGVPIMAEWLRPVSIIWQFCANCLAAAEVGNPLKDQVVGLISAEPETKTARYHAGSIGVTKRAASAEILTK